MKKRIQDFIAEVVRYNRVVDDYKRAADNSPDHSMAYVNWGVELAMADKLEEAMEKFRQAHEIAPSRYEPYLNWGMALAKLSRWEEAAEKFQQAIARDGKVMAPYILWGAVLIEQGQLEEARQQYEKAIAINPHNPEPYVNWGTALARRGDYHEAIKLIKQALAIYGHQPQLCFLWGAILAELQDYAGAIEKFRLTLRFLPKYAEAYYFWSVALNRLGRYEEALEKSRKAIALNLETPEVYLNQGDILASLNRLDVAIMNYKQAIALNAEVPAAYLCLGIALCRLAQYEDGYAQFEKSLALNAEHGGVHAQWGQFLLEQGRYEEALSHLRVAVGQDDTDLDSLLNLSLALIQLEQRTEAVELLLEMEQRDKWNPTVHYLLGTHFLGADELIKARQHFEKALEEKPDFDDAAVNLALTLCEQGETLEAVRCMRPVIRRLPDSARINFFYGVMLYRHGDYREAQAKYEKALNLQPDYLEARLGLAESFLRLNRLSEAADCLEVAREQQPETVSVLYLLGLVNLRQAEAAVESAEQAVFQTQARDYFTHLVALDPSHLEGRANLALLQGHMHSVEAMNAAFTRLVDDVLPMLRALALYYWAVALKQLNQPEAAEAKLAQARAEDAQIESYMERLAL